MESLQKQFTTEKKIPCNLGCYLNSEAQISNFISDTQIPEFEIN